MAVSFEIPESEPSKIQAGTTIAWKKSLSDFLPSDGWTLSYALVMAGNKIDIAAGDLDDEHYIEIDPTTSGAYTAGEYRYQAIVTHDTTGEVVLIGTGAIEILVSFAAQADGYDARSTAKKNLDALDSILPDVLAKRSASYSIGGRSLSYRTLEEWQSAYDFWLAKYLAEERQAGRRPARSKIKSQLR